MTKQSQEYNILVHEKMRTNERKGVRVFNVSRTYSFINQNNSQLLKVTEVNIMKKNVVLIFVALCLVFVYCGGGRRVESAPQAYDTVILNAESKQDDGTVLVLKIIQLAKPSDSSFPVIGIVNDLDRAVKLDFDGASHYTESVPDRREKKITIMPGSYKILVSAPGLLFTPPKESVNFMSNTMYVLGVNRLKEKVDYEK